MHRIVPPRAISTLAALVLFSLPSTVRAQDPTAAPSSSQRLYQLFGGLSPDQDVQIVTPEFFIEEAEFMTVDPQMVEVQREGSTIPVSLADIRAVSVKSAHGLQGTLWGTGAGILIGAVSGMMIESFSCTDELECSAAEKQGAVRWGVSLGLLGGITGYFFGHRSEYWRPLFP